jgi:hypothetical protein
MLTLRPSRPLLVAAAGAAAALAVAAPAGATEGTTTAPPPPPWNLTAPGFGPAASAPFTSAVHRRPTIRRARIVPNRIRKGKRATLRLSLPQGGKVKYTIARMSAPHRGRVTARTVSVPSGKVSIRLPRGVHGRALAAGRYRVTAVVVDAQGGRSRTVSRSLIVRSAHR